MTKEDDRELLVKTIRRLEKRIEELEAELAKNKIKKTSQNNSKPPSQDFVTTYSKSA